MALPNILQGGSIMKKISKLLTVVLALCMAFSTVAFAAEPEKSVTEESDIQMYALKTADEDSVQPLDAAPPLTSAKITRIYQDTKGKTFVEVEATGYGTCKGYVDGRRATLSGSKPVGVTAITGFVYTFDCGVLTSGTHTFEYTGTSINPPKKTINIERAFDVP